MDLEGKNLLERAVPKKMTMKKLLVHLGVVLSILGCNNSKKMSGTILGKNTQDSNSFELVATLPIERGSLLNKTSSDNWEIPDQIYLKDSQIFILSGYEKKLISYSIGLKEFKDETGINNIISKDSIHSPVKIIVTDKNILVGYDFKIEVFNKERVYVCTIPFNSQCLGITDAMNSKFNIWFSDSVVTYQGEDSVIQRLSFIPAAIDQVDYSVCFQNTMSTEFYRYEVGNNSIKQKPISIPHSKSAGFPNHDNATLLFINNTNYVWLISSKTSDFLLVENGTGTCDSINLSGIFTQQPLSFVEDRFYGIRTTGDNGVLILAFMITVFDKKEIKIYAHPL
jgi:hypothetical protein